MNHKYVSTMRLLKFLLMGFVFLSASIVTQAQSCMMTPLSLNERVNSSDLIVEGKILGQKAFWNHDNSKIYTVNKIEVYKVFKGTLMQNVVSVLTEGGIVGNKMMTARPSLGLVTGEVGMFTLKMSGTTLTNYDPNFIDANSNLIGTNGNRANVAANSVNETLFLPVGAAQGYINYDRYKQKAVGVFDSYTDVVNDLYIGVNNITNRGFLEIKPFVANDFIKQTNNGSRATVVVTSITNPATATNSASAGTYTEIEIVGSGFGTSVGQLRFPNADDGGATTINCPVGLILSWTDTQIDVLVPSGASTGSVEVRNATTGSGTGTLIVPYNVSNLGSSGVENAADMINTNAVGGYTWTYSTNFYSNPDAVARFGESLCEWTGATGINWDTASTTSTVACEASGDGVNIVAFDNSCGLSSGVLGTCYSYYSGCYGASGLSWYVSELDIKFDASQNWNFTAGAPAFAEYDFKSVAMHEVGHGHQLGHFALSSDIMYWSLTNGAQNTTIDANAANGGLFVMDRNGTTAGNAAFDAEIAHVGHSGGSFAANECGPGRMIPYTCTVGPSCFDGIQNQDETAIDCGGASCQTCATKCSNGIQDGSETGIDCGGPCTACCTPPANDSIQFAVVGAVCGVTVNNVDNSCSTNDPDYAIGCVSGENMMWYSIDLGALEDGFDLTVSNSSTGANFEIVIIGNYPNAPAAYGVDCGAVGTYSYSGLPQDSVYYIGIGTTNSEVGTFDLCVTATGSACVGGAPANDEICNAVALTMNACQTILQTDSCATADYTDGACIEAGSMSVWYSFRLSNPNNQVEIYFDTNTFLGGSVGMMVLDSACLSPLFEWSDCGNANSDTFRLTNLEYDSTYYLMVSNPQGSQGDFKLCINESFDPCVAAPAANDSICNASFVAFGVGGQTCLTNQTNNCSFPDYSIGCIDANTNTVWYEFDLDSTNSEIEITFDNITTTDDTLRVGIIEAIDCDTLSAWVYNSCIRATTDTITLSQLDSTARYFILIGTDIGSEGNWDMCLTQSIDPCFSAGAPANDSICAATIIPVDSTCLTGQSNECANRSEVFGGCFSAANSTIWYRFTMSNATANQMDVFINNHTFDGDVSAIVMGVPAGTPCAQVSTIGLNYGTVCQHPDSGAFTFDQLSDTIDYYLGIGSPSTDEGTFEICLQEGTKPPGTIVGPEQDCSGAISLCSSSWTQTESYIGAGIQELVDGTTCIGTEETNSLWFVFTVQSTDSFGFNIVTANDYDFALYNISIDGCAGIPGQVPDRCNWCYEPGNTGLDETTWDPTFGLSEPGSNPCNKIMDGLWVNAGETYALMIDNYTADNEGFTIDFEGASIYDTIPPQLWSAGPDCGNNAFIITTDEPIQCASIDLSDFNIFNQDDGLDWTAQFDTAYGIGCTGATGQTTNTIILQHNGTIPSGNYRVSIAPVPGPNALLADKCDNLITVGGYVDLEYVIANLAATADKYITCTAGDAVVITATGLPIGEVYLLNPVGAANSSGVFTVNPTTTTTYTISSTYAGCLITTNITIQVISEFTTIVDPTYSKICNGTIDIIATSTINGNPCKNCVFSWGAPIGRTSGYTQYDTANVGDGTYTVQASSPLGCDATLENFEVDLATAGSGGVCEVMYVAGDGVGVGANSGLTKDSPTTLDSALARAICTNTVIKCAVGTYSYDEYLSVNSYITIEGGFDANYLTKSSNMTGTNGTRFIRSATTADDGTGAGTEYSMFKVVSGSEAFRFQDIRIVMPDHVAGAEKTNKAINMATNCVNYFIVRCDIDAGSGSDE